MILITAAEAAFRLRVSMRVLRRQIEAGKFPPPRRIGRMVRFLVSEVEAYAHTLPVHKLQWRDLPADRPPATGRPSAEEEQLMAASVHRRYDHVAAAAAEAAFAAEIAANQPRRLPRGPKGQLPLP